MSWFKSNLISVGPLRSARSYVPSDGGIGEANNMMTDLVLSDIQKAISDLEKKKVKCILFVILILLLISIFRKMRDNEL